MRYVYILRCKDNSYYIGQTMDLSERIKCHNQGRGAEYTKLRRPVELVYFESFKDDLEAKRREGEIKSFSRFKKEYLIKYGLGEKVSLVT